MKLSVGQLISKLKRDSYFPAHGFHLDRQCRSQDFAFRSCCLLRSVFRGCQRVATWILRVESTSLKIIKARTVKITKCSESLWKLACYSSLLLCGIMVIYHEPWFNNVEEFYRGWPNQELKFFRTGSVVLALHDASDVFLEAAKVLKYFEKEFGASVCFGLFACSWFVLRLVYFPFWVIWSFSFYSAGFLNLSDPYHMSLYYIFNSLLLTLLVFHIYWWYLISSMIMRQLKNRGKVGEDIRSGIRLNLVKTLFNSLNKKDVEQKDE
ncbi:OLC1v1000104C2 [Oldenlandia corymbosa var. corymbosa]|uniref:OLC1v1000104C2 n=1 Tax=Oldenlandia corymbosa var. corymbosa TaxID=529605 RepID=A0AAV1D2X0_OLDCO|nr:OLC1v1000104C2 [Oldenlandia corymbosa var. corymbosa]